MLDGSNMERFNQLKLKTELCTEMSARWNMIMCSLPDGNILEELRKTLGYAYNCYNSIVAEMTCVSSAMSPHERGTHEMILKEAIKMRYRFYQKLCILTSVITLADLQNIIAETGAEISKLMPITLPPVERLFAPPHSFQQEISDVDGTL